MNNVDRNRNVMISDQRNDKERYKERHGITPFFGFSLKVLSHDLS